MLIKENVLKKKLIKDLNGFNFEELSNIHKINLRGESTNKDFVTNIGRILNTLLPVEPNTYNQNNELRIIWLGPNEWLIEIYETSNYEKILSDLKNSLNPENTAITDVTENRTVLKLSGIPLFKLLSKFMIIDLEKTLKKEYSVAQTIFIKVPVLIIRNYKDKQSVYLHTNRSHAQYIIDLLIDGSKNINF